MAFWNRKTEPATAKTAPRVTPRRYVASADKNLRGGFMPTSSEVERSPAQLPMIRRQARNLAHQNPYAARAVSVLMAATIGKGIRVSISGDPAYKLAFTRWASSKACDHDGDLNFYALQALISRTMFEAGDVFCVMRDVRTPNGIAPQIQVIDPDLIHETATPRYAKNTVIAGVEVNSAGAVVGYHVREDTSSFTSLFVPKSDMLHFYEKLFPGQIRGIPRGAQALARTNSVDNLMSMALARARVEASMALVVTTTGDGDYSLSIDGDDEEVFEYDRMPEYIDAGMIAYLRPGEDVTSVVPAGTGGLSEYIKVSLQAVSAAYGCTYSQISCDLSISNYSSIKAGTVDFHTMIESTREHFFLPQLARIEERFRATYEASNDVDVDCRVALTPPGRESIEPAKEALSDMTAVNAGGMTVGQYLRKRGLDFDEQMEEIAAERKKMADLGIELRFGSFVPALIDAAAAEDQQQAIEDGTGSTSNNA